jgi:hypothetical protein
VERVVLECERRVLEKIQIGNQIGRNQREACEEQAGIHGGDEPDSPVRLVGDGDSAHVPIQFRVDFANTGAASALKAAYKPSMARINVYQARGPRSSIHHAI